MGIFDKIKKKLIELGNETESKVQKINSTYSTTMPKFADSSSIPPEEKQYYRPDEYYQYIVHEGDTFEQRILDFEQRKKSSYPSQRGLFVPEVLLLHYCTYGTYPNPKSGYPGFWWFQYGIRDVGQVLRSLEQRGFICFKDKSDMLCKLTIPQLKNILTKFELETKGKKDELLNRIVTQVPKAEIEAMDIPVKYELTELGTLELKDNEYIPYMCNHPRKTIENLPEQESFTVWDMNKLIAPEGKQSEWKEIVGLVEMKKWGVNLVKTIDEHAHEEDISYDTSEMRSFLLSKEAEIKKRSLTEGDGYEEASKGYLYNRGKDYKNALVEFFIAINKKFDAPAAYTQAIDILKKFKLYEEAIAVINAGLKNLDSSSRYFEELQKKKEDLLKKCP